MSLKPTICTIILFSLGTAAAVADELTQMVQQDLMTLGYDPGATTGEMTTATIVAVSKFQAENQLEVTGEVTPQLAGVLKAAINKQNSPGAAAAPAMNVNTAPPARSQAELQAAQQACLQQKMAEAQAAQKKKRGFGRLMSAVTRTAMRTGNYDLGRSVGDVYSATATADDLSAAAKDLGLSEDAVAACQNPG
jgi:peptidoglycan hydrolase-like protein with peptidoglycan-binding domain